MDSDSSICVLSDRTNAAVHPENRARRETRIQGQTLAQIETQPTAVPLRCLVTKQSIQEVTHESPPHNSHVATLKLRGPPILPWKVYKHYIGKRLKRKKRCHFEFIPQN